MVTIRDVAKRAGVAVSTVSKVINRYPSVSEDTIARVNEAIEELHFIPNSVAASLSSKQSFRVPPAVVELFNIVLSDESLAQT